MAICAQCGDEMTETCEACNRKMCTMCGCAVCSGKEDIDGEEDEDELFDDDSEEDDEDLEDDEDDEDEDEKE